MKRLLGIWMMVGSLMMGSVTVAHADYAAGLKAAQSGDFAAALREWKPLANIGDAASQYNVGLIHHRGLGIAQNFGEAAKWYRKAANQGMASAQLNLGLMYENGQGVAQDHRAAVKWYREAAIQRDIAAQFNLGIMYNFGRGVTRNYKEAAKWYRKAAEMGDAMAQQNLGVMYARGHGVPYDIVTAFMWVNVSAANNGVLSRKSELILEGIIMGDKKGSVSKKELEMQTLITTSQLAKARRLARECLKKNYQGCGR
jgi:uncharacterized protein